jgi:broad specificity phosphatase PhoE
VQWEAAGLLYVGRFAEIAELTKAGQQQAERFGLGRSRGSMLGANRASALEALGRWDEALEVLEDLRECSRGSRNSQYGLSSPVSCSGRPPAQARIAGVCTVV